MINSGLMQFPAFCCALLSAGHKSSPHYSLTASERAETIKENPCHRLLFHSGKFLRSTSGRRGWGWGLAKILS